MSCPPSQRVVDTTKLAITNGQSVSITECMNFLSYTSSGDTIKSEYVTDRSDYTGVEPWSHVNRGEDIGERTERKTGYLMSREQKHILTNLKEEEEDGVRDEEGLWKKAEKEKDEYREGHITHQVGQTDKLLMNGVKSEHGHQEGEEPSTMVTSCLLKQPRVLIHRLKIANCSVSVSSLLPPVAYERGQGVRSPWRCHEISSLRGNASLTQKGQVVTRKRKGQLETPQKLMPVASENGICAEASLISPATSPKNTEQAVEVSSQGFACSQCPFIHTEEVNLHQHIEKVHPEELSRTVGTQQPPSSTHQHPTPPKTLSTPTQSHTGTPGAHTCSQCGKSFKSKSLLATHMKILKQEHSYIQCGKRLSSLKKHQQTHPGKHPCQCSQCGKGFSRSSALKRHQVTHTGERPYHCSQCGKNFTQLGHLMAHQKIHTGERPYHCSQCGKSFIVSGALMRHQRIHTGERAYHCSQCGKSFTVSGTLMRHQRIHTGERPYHCSQCGKSFTVSGTLIRHQRIHTGERPYHCSQCGKSFTVSASLMAHQRVHTGERPYHCSQCGKSFTVLSSLMAHQRVHTGERPYHCSQCGKSFRVSNDLKRHQTVHTGQRPYHCSQCGKSFTQLCNLLKHQRTHTRESQYCS